MSRALVLGALATLALSARARAHDAPDPAPDFGARGEIVVEEELPASTSVVTSREIAAVPKRTAEDALRLVPGVFVVQHGSEGKGVQLFLRGFDAVHGADLEVTVDDIPVNEPSNVHGHGYVDLGFVIPEVVERVEVVKGPFTLEQGAFALAGSARYRLAVPYETRGLRASYTAGTTNRHRGVVTFTPRDGDGRDFVAVEALHDDGFGDRRRIDRGAMVGKLRLLDSEARGTLTAGLALHAASFELPGVLRNEDVEAGRVDIYGSYDREMRGASRRAIASVDYLRSIERGELRAKAWAGLRSLELLENYTGFLIDPDQGDRRAQSHRAASFGATLTTDLALSSKTSLLLGFGTRAGVLEQRQAQVAFDSDEELGVQRSASAVQSISHALLALRADVPGVLRVTAGARLDLIHVDARDRIDPSASGSGVVVVASPRVVVSAPVSHHLVPKVAYGRGFRPPEARAFTGFSPDRVGTPSEVYAGGAPTHTASDSFEAGALFFVNRAFSGELAGFATLVANENVYDHVSGTNLSLNRTRRLGAEVRLSSRPLDWLEVIADGTAVDARFVDSGAPVPLAPRLLGSIRALADHPKGFRGGLRLVGMTSRPLPHGAKGASFASLDVTAGYTWKALRFDLEIENLTNRRSREGEYHFASHWARGTSPSELPVLHSIAAPPLNARLTLTVVH